MQSPPAEFSCPKLHTCFQTVFLRHNSFNLKLLFYNFSERAVKIYNRQCNGTSCACVNSYVSSMMSRINSSLITAARSRSISVLCFASSFPMSIPFISVKSAVICLCAVVAVIIIHATRMQTLVAQHQPFSAMRAESLIPKLLRVPHHFNFSIAIWAHFCYISTSIVLPGVEKFK